MSKYKGFISWDKYKELTDQLSQLIEQDGLKNKFDHLYSPDTDMADIICENLETSKEMILLDIYSTIIKYMNLAHKIIKLRRD